MKALKFHFLRDLSITWPAIALCFVFEDIVNILSAVGWVFTLTTVISLDNFYSQLKKLAITKVHMMYVQVTCAFEAAASFWVGANGLGLYFAIGSLAAMAALSDMVRASND